MLIAHFLNALAKILHFMAMAAIWILVIRAVLSWIPVPSLRPLIILLQKWTEPVLKPVRRIVPPYKTGGLDISPLIVILVIVFIDSFLIQSMSHYAQSMIRHGRLDFSI